MFDTLIQIPVKIANCENIKSPKPPKLVSLRLRGKRGTTLKTSRDKQINKVRNNLL